MHPSCKVIHVSYICLFWKLSRDCSVWRGMLGDTWATVLRHHLRFRRSLSSFRVLAHSIILLSTFIVIACRSSSFEVYFSQRKHSMYMGSMLFLRVLLLLPSSIGVAVDDRFSALCNLVLMTSSSYDNEHCLLLMSLQSHHPRQTSQGPD